MVDKRGFVALQISSGMLYEHDDGNFNTLIFGFVPDSRVDLPVGYTHFGVVVTGEILLVCGERMRSLTAGDFFSAVGPATIQGNGLGMVNSARGYYGVNLFGGPLEKTGRLRYIDGCTDSLLVPPVRKGDPCLNHLHFPSGITQTPHTHPSVRSGLVYRGCGVCIVPEEHQSINLVEGCAFIIHPDSVHSFNTDVSSMDIIAFHPDSDTGMTDDDHPMINRTIVDGVSARSIDKIRTR